MWGGDGALILDGGLAVAAALMLASAMSWRSARSARERATRAGIDATRHRLDELRRRHAAGEFDQDELDLQERRVATDLLEPGPAAGQAASRSRQPWMLALAAIVVAVAAALVHTWVGQPGAPG
jgi:cytochrome c-type biogenesis protein CcmI